MGVTLQLVDVKVFRENEFADKARESGVIGVVEERFLYVECNPPVGLDELQGREKGLGGGCRQILKRQPTSNSRNATRIALPAYHHSI